MLNSIVRRSALAVALIALIVPASQMFAAGPTTPTVVTGGDPQPMGEAMPVLLTLPSLVVL